MSNPKAPRVSRRPGGPIVPIGTLDEDPGELPVERFRRLGAADEVVDYLQAVWDTLDEDSRVEWRTEFDVLTDVELTEELDDIAVEDFPPIEEVAAALTSDDQEPDGDPIPTDPTDPTEATDADVDDEASGDDEASADDEPADDDGEVEGEVLERPDDAEPGTQLPDSIDEATGEQLPPAVDGRVEHEGGGWYSVWINDENVTGDDNIRGRDEAEARLADELDDRFGSIDEG